MQYNFDTVTDRRGTDSIKYDFAVRHGKPADILPLWVADMDFPAPPAVLEALAERSRHGIFGYSDAAGEEYFQALAAWYDNRFDWKLNPRWLLKSPGVVFAIGAAIRALTEMGDAVLIQQPVYSPFQQSVENNGRRAVINKLVYADCKYTVDLNDFEDKIVKNRVKLFILCSPHNPVGRVWTREELTAMGELCIKHGVRVVSDEIHADFVYSGYRHQVFAAIKDAFADISVICTAPSKTFNLAGLQISNIWIPNTEIRRKVRAEIYKTGYDLPNVMGLVACRAAYAHGAPWLDGLKEYLSANLTYVRSFLAEQLPQIQLTQPEGTYLVWLNCRALGLTDEQLDELIIRQAGLWLDAGTLFGAGGEGFQRVNIACPRAILEQAMKKLKAAVDTLPRQA